MKSSNVYVNITSTVEYDYVPPPTEIPHHRGNLLSADPLTTENSSYGLGDNEEKEEFSKCRHNLKDVYIIV